jgi:hypothetical protein
MSIKRIITAEEAGSRLKRETAHFLSYAAAIRHYRDEGYYYAATDVVLKKLRNNQISIGMPPLGKGLYGTCGGNRPAGAMQTQRGPLSVDGPLHGERVSHRSA